VGDRGGLYGPEDVERYDESGIEYHTMEALDDRGPAAIARRIGEVVEGPTFATIDVDVADPAFAPGTGTPSPGGVSSRELRGLVRSLRGVDLVGFDHVEVAPPYDSDGITTVLGATVAFEALCAMLAGGDGA